MYTTTHLKYFVGLEVEIILQKNPNKKYYGVLEKIELSKDESPIDALSKSWLFELVSTNNKHEKIISFYPKEVKYINKLKS